MNRAILLAALGLLGCVPLDGSECDDSSRGGLCVGDRVSVCQNHRWVSYPCRGGCSVTGRLPDAGLAAVERACRFGTQDLGQPCPQILTPTPWGAWGVAACGSRKGTAIVCDGEKWTETVCQAQDCYDDYSNPSGGLICHPVKCVDPSGQEC